KKVYFSLLEKPALQNSGALILAPTEAKSIKALHLNTPIFAIPNGVHPSDFEISPDLELFYQRFPDTRNKTLIVFLGRIHPKKGLDLLATAFSRVHRQFPQTHLIVAGPDNTGFLPTVKNYFVKVNCSAQT
ncbi:glycosyltransferase, partial [Aetokthonos hydrillicola]|uniref:glycosyltransferase n=1 Tax=Aetokthonos hydrillicola TaxID=1550245 RepID=UPI001ABB7698